MTRYGIAVALIALAPTLAWAHGGGLDKNGCHHDKKAGDYHCHKGDHAGKHYKNEGEMMSSMKGHGAQGEKMKDEHAGDKHDKAEKKGAKKKEAAGR